MLAVFERIDISLLEMILASAAGESSLSMVTFTNQPTGRGHSVPDARISARFAYWFEVKTARNALSSHQLSEHLANLQGEGDERLFVVTPDADQPAAVTHLADRRVVWFNFRSLHDAIERSSLDVTSGISEQQRFLLRELQALPVEDGLVDNDDAVVVAARFGYPEYLKRAVYICQPERAFRGGLTHMAFYANGAIQVHVPRISHREDLVSFTREEAVKRCAGTDIDRAVGAAIEADLDAGTREDGKQYQVFLLSSPDDPETVTLAHPILNDTVAESGRPWAWTMGQRYVSLAKLCQPDVTRTSDLGPG
ncbi:MAG: hypothetical protein ACLQBX_08320 [Candidatus Limnocylindrales bacterium]